MTTGPTRPGDALSETQRRFLVAVMERVPRALVHEVYLFAPMKQGSMETGIAVVAIAEPAPEAALETSPDGSGHVSDEPAGGDAGEVAVADGVASDGAHDGEPADAGEPSAGAAIAVGDCDPTESAAGEVVDAETPEADAEAEDAHATDADTTDVDTTATDATGEGGTDVGAADVGAADAGVPAGEPPPDGGDDDLPPPAPTRVARFTVFTARYRLQLKGPERGKWDVDVVEEADAPLVTVDAVVRGVHRRSGEPSEVERLAPHDLARALGEVPWTSES